MKETLTSQGSDHLIDGLYDTVLEGCQWGDALFRICTHFNASAGALFVHDFVTGEGEIRYDFNFDTEYIESRDIGFPVQTAWPHPERNHKGAVQSLGDEISPQLEWVESVFHRPSKELPDVPYRLCGVVSKIGLKVTWVSLFRSEKFSPFRKKDKAALGYILPHVKRALMLYDRRVEMGNFRDLLDNLPIASFLVAPSGRLLFHNCAAERILRNRDGLMARNGFLVAASRNVTAELKRLIELAVGCKSNGDNGENGKNLVIMREPGSLPLVCALFAVRGAGLNDKGDNDVAVAIIVKDLDNGNSGSLSDFASAFQLTKAEVRLIGGLNEGNGLFETAQHLGISNNTARTHMRNIYSKVGINRQADVVRLLEKFNLF